jgi:Domain of unknown function (DUF4331)
MNTHKPMLSALALLMSLTITACSSNPAPSGPGVDASTDTPIATDNPITADGADAYAGDTTCTTYCAQMMTHCTGMSAQYDSNADCMSYCMAARWPAGTPGATSGNTLACRIYHSGMPAMTSPSTHCPHAGPSGDNTCGPLMFRTEAPAMYRRVDRMGMPAVSTALLPTGRKEAYNDVNGRGDMGAFTTDIARTHGELAVALRPHLIALGLAPCSVTEMVLGLPRCLAQEYAPGATVASLILPDDAITVTPASPAGFPNGRRLEDQVIDITLSVLFLDLRGTCNGRPCSATTLTNPPLNPPRNDLPFLDSFPYLAAAHRAP